MSITIFKGADASITVSLKDKTSGDPIDLVGFTGASAFFAQEDSDEPLSVTGVLVSEDLGKISFALNEEETTLLKAGDENNMEVLVDQGATRTIVQFEGQVAIKPRLF